MALKLKVSPLPPLQPNISFSTVCVPEVVGISNPSQTQVSGLSAYKLASFLPSSSLSFNSVPIQPTVANPH